MTITVEQMVQREVMCCMSNMVGALAQGGHGILNQVKCHDMTALNDLCAQAVELTFPVLDYEEAATQAGWTRNVSRISGAVTFTNDGRNYEMCEGWQDLCEQLDIEPYEWEVFEHWAVSTWLAEKLIAQGERVETDFAGLNVWARTCTGQAISMDACMVRIHAAMLEAK